MKTLHNVLMEMIAVCCVLLCTVEPATGERIYAWGLNDLGQCDVPAGNDFLAVAAGWDHGIALRSDGSLVGWGDNTYGQATVPAGNDFVAISSWYRHNLALKSDGCVVAWGSNASGQCDVPPGSDYAVISAGKHNSYATRADGSLVAWGWDAYGQLNVPSGNNYVAVAGGWANGIALKSDGSFVQWGWNGHGLSDRPYGNDFVAIDSGSNHNVAIRTDGSLVAWGTYLYDHSNVPSGNDFVAISAGGHHNLALRADGSVAVWGLNDYGEGFAPQRTGYTAIAAGPTHNLALGTELGILTGPVHYNGHHYYLLENSKWSDAEAKAVEMGGHLVAINDAAEDAWVYETFSDNGERDLWLGLNDEENEGTFVWSSGDAVTYANWGSAQPDNWGERGEHYAHMSAYLNGKWNDFEDQLHLFGFGDKYLYGVVEIIPEPGIVSLLAVGAVVALKRRSRIRRGGKNSA